MNMVLMLAVLLTVCPHDAVSVESVFFLTESNVVVETLCLGRFILLKWAIRDPVTKVAACETLGSVRCSLPFASLQCRS